jgi:hypothetical protein
MHAAQTTAFRDERQSDLFPCAVVARARAGGGRSPSSASLHHGRADLQVLLFARASTLSFLHQITQLTISMA